MSKLLKGAVSFTAFRPEGEVPSRERTRELIDTQLFKPLRAEEERDESVGWVDAIWSFDTERLPNLFSGATLLLSVRIDRYAFSSSQLRPYLEEAEYHYKTTNKLEYISAQQTKEIRDAEIRKMRTNSYPKTQIVEIAWKIDDKIVYIFSKSSSAIKRFIPLFENSFGFSLVQTDLINEELASAKSHDGTNLLNLWEGQQNG